MVLVLPLWSCDDVCETITLICRPMYVCMYACLQYARQLISDNVIAVGGLLSHIIDRAY